MEEVARVFCTRCREPHDAQVRLDEDGFPEVEWREPHRSPQEAREAAIEPLVAGAGSAFVIAVETGHFDLADHVIERSLGGLFGLPHRREKE